MTFSIVYCVTVLIYATHIPDTTASAGKELIWRNTTQPPSVALVEASTTTPPSTTTVTKTTTTTTTTTTSRPFLQGLRLPCSCVEGQCGCCTGVILDRFNQKACLNVTYEPDDFALTAAMSFNGRILYKRTVSGKNPPPMCVRIPRLQFIRFCVEFSNIYLASRNIHLCIDMEANWEDLTLLEWSFDCIRMGAAGVAVVGPEEGGGVPARPIDAVDQTDEDYDDSARNTPPLVAAGRRRVPHACHQLIFDADIKRAATQKADKSLIKVKKLHNGDCHIFYDKNKLG